MKKYLFLTFILVILGISTSIAYANTDGTYTFTISKDEATITGVVSKDEFNGSKIIPKELGGYPVTKISEGAFESCTSLTKITVPDSVTSIGQGAFKWCSALEEICLPYATQGKSGILSRFGYIFGYTSVTDPSIRYGKNNPNESYTTGLYVPGGATYQNFYVPAIYGGNDYQYIYYYFYIPSSLKKVTITKDSSIPENCFYNCKNMISITLPDEATSINSYAFYNCNSLTDITIPEKVCSIGASTFQSCTSLNKIIIPNNVTSIEKSTFSGCTELIDVLLPESIITIGERAFYNCKSLSKIKIPKYVSSINNGAFSGCTGLSGVYITDLTAWCNIYFGNGNDFGNPLLYAKKLYINDELAKDIVIPDDVTIIKNAAFYGCNFTSVIIPNNVKQIGNYAFRGKIDKIYLPSALISEKSNLKNATNAEIYLYDYIVSYVLNNQTLMNDYVEEGKDSIPPVPPEGYTYRFFVNDAIWSGENITSNTTVKVIMLITPSSNKISMSCVDFSFDKNAVNAHYYLMSENTSNICGIFYLASYNAEGYLVGIYQEEINTNNTEYNLHANIKNSEKPTYLRSFFWGGKSKMIPLGDSITTIAVN